ncbi:iron ABC transporter permease, partial [Vibrio parahaemolyticus]|nr:iron ABC transporter permease [Vibrio parahaemolyticus]
MSTLVWQKTASLVIQSLRGLLLAVGILLALILLAVTVGQSRISVQTVYHTLANNLFAAQYAVDLIDAGVLWEYRLSRAVIAS